ncbi:MAG: hypothetical protein PHT60_14965 [Acidiphilium sp.]|nr:hypothetical protein [Acidiphilium sp.]MDD4937063.1 hypothetical protein [Acidiphilium sp.]
MAFLVLRFGVHPSSLGGYATGLVGKDVIAAIAGRDHFICRFCGLPVPGHPQIFFLDGDRRHDQPDNLATACLACALVQGGARYTAAAEIIPVWLPEMSQRSLNRLISSLHELALGVSLPVNFSRAPAHDTAQARLILKLWSGLAERRATLKEMTGLRNVADFVDACLAHDPYRGRCPAGLGHGLRFLHRGRYFADGQDIYPQVLACRVAKPAVVLAA